MTHTAATPAPPPRLPELSQAPVPFHFMRKTEVLAAVGMSKSTLHLWMNEGRFPKPVSLSTTVPVWVSTEVVAWMTARVAERDGKQTLAA